MKENLQNLGYFSAYVANTIQNDTNGALTIINSDESESRLELYIDNEFIASGFGFPDKASYTTAITYIGDLGSKMESIDNIIATMENKIIKNSSLEYTYESSIINAEYNEYGMPFSYSCLNLTYNDGEDRVSYIIEKTKKTNHNYIKGIEVSIDDETNDYYITDNIIANIKLSFNNSSSEGLEDYVLQCAYCGNTLDKELSSLSINNATNTVQIKADPVEESKKEDLTINILHKYNNSDNGSDNNYVVYSYVYKDIFNWKDKLIYSHNFTGNLLTYYSNVSKYNLNDYNIKIHEDDKTSPDERKSNELYNNFMKIINYSEKYDFYEFDKEIKLEYNNGQLLYDYIIADKQLNINFYFNGIKPNNWVNKEINFSTDGENSQNLTYYIYQSPQRYIGEHTWTIKITKDE